MYKGGFFTRLKVMFKATGTETNRLDNPWDRFWYAVVDVFAHRKIFREPYQGIFHFTHSLGVHLLFLGAMIDFFQVDIIEPIWHAWFMEGISILVYSVITDVCRYSWCSSASHGLYRRYVMKPKWLDEKAEDMLILWFILAIIVTGFVVEGSAHGMQRK